MKKLISTILLASALVGTALGVSVSAAESGTNYGKVPMTDAKITIDGKKDAIYDKGLSIKIDKPLARTTKTATATGTMKLLWNGKDTIYMYTEIKDSEPIVYETLTNAWDTRTWARAHATSTASTSRARRPSTTANRPTAETTARSTDSRTGRSR